MSLSVSSIWQWGCFLRERRRSARSPSIRNTARYTQNHWRSLLPLPDPAYAQIEWRRAELETGFTDADDLRTGADASLRGHSAACLRTSWTSSAPRSIRPRPPNDIPRASPPNGYYRRAGPIPHTEGTVHR